MQCTTGSAHSKAIRAYSISCDVLDSTINTYNITYLENFVVVLFENLLTMRLLLHAPYLPNVVEKTLLQKDALGSTDNIHHAPHQARLF